MNGSNGSADRACALITGGTVRVGLAIALALAQSGRDIFLHCRNHDGRADDAVRAIRDVGRQAWIVSADLADPADIAAMFDRIREISGRLDVLVNSAAVFGTTPPDALTADDFDHFIGTNLRAPYLCSIHSRKLMGPGSCIVNIADVAAERPFRNHVPYCVSKAGVVMLTRSLAKAWAPEIRVNAVSPGTVLFRDDEDDALRRAVVSRIPMGHIGSPQDVARAVMYLVDQADHTTGSVLNVDGGRSLD